jgi:hypothetical protein
MADVDHSRQDAVADQQPADGVDGPLGGGQPDPERALVAQRLQSLQGERQVRAALVAGDGVDLVHDHRLDAPQGLPSPLAGHQQVQRFGGRDDEAGRPAHHEGPLRAGCVSSPHGHPDGGRRETQFGRHCGDLGQRTLEIFGDVHRQGPKG